MLDPDNLNVFCSKANQPNEFENTCYADFATNYSPSSADIYIHLFQVGQSVQHFYIRRAYPIKFT